MSWTAPRTRCRNCRCEQACSRGVVVHRSGGNRQWQPLKSTTAAVCCCKWRASETCCLLVVVLAVITITTKDGRILSRSWEERLCVACTYTHHQLHAGTLRVQNFDTSIGLILLDTTHENKKSNLKLIGYAPLETWKKWKLCNTSSYNAFKPFLYWRMKPVCNWCSPEACSWLRSWGNPPVSLVHKFCLITVNKFSEGWLGHCENFPRKCISWRGR
jgi:hypothetical protein